MNSRRARLKVQPKVKDSSSRATTVIKNSVAVPESSEKCSELKETSAGIGIIKDFANINNKLTSKTAWQDTSLKMRCDLQKDISNESFPGPKLKVGLDGKVRIDEESLVIPRILSPVYEKIVEDKRSQSKTSDKICKSASKAKIPKSNIADESCKSTIKNKRSKSNIRGETCKSTIKDTVPKSRVRNKTCKSTVKNKNLKSKTQDSLTSHSLLEEKTGRKVSCQNQHKIEKCKTTINSPVENICKNGQIICNNSPEVDGSVSVCLKPATSTKEKNIIENEVSQDRQSGNHHAEEPSDIKNWTKTNETVKSIDPNLSADLVNAHSEESFPGPKLKIGPNGKVTIDEESLFIQRTSPHFSDKEGSGHWDRYDTASFYQALSCFGTDFTFIAEILKKWSRKNIKRKYFNEYKKNPRLVNWVVKHASVTKVSTWNLGECESSDESTSEENTADIEKEISLHSGNSASTSFAQHSSAVPDSVNCVEDDVNQNDSGISQSEDLANNTAIMQHPLPTLSVTNCQFVTKDLCTKQQQTCENQHGSTDNRSDKEHTIDAKIGVRLTVDLKYIQQNKDECGIDDKMTSLKNDEREMEKVELMKSNVDFETKNVKLTIMCDRFALQKAVKRKWQPNISKHRGKKNKL